MAKDKKVERLYNEEKLRRTEIRKEKRLQKKGSTNICPKCRRDTGSYVPTIMNPYYDDINGVEIYEKMCHNCYEDACGDI